MSGSETTVVVLSDSDNESESTQVVTIDESDVIVDSEIEVITLDDSNVNQSKVTFDLDTSPDFIPINGNIQYDKDEPQRGRKRRFADFSPVYVSKRQRTTKKGKQIIALAKNNIKTFNRYERKRQKFIASKKSKRTEKSVSLDTQTKSENDATKPKTPQIQLSHTNIHNFVNTPRLAGGLRPVILDGCNVAFGFGNGKFQIEGIIFVIEYFQKRGHKDIVSFLPQIYRNDKFRSLDVAKQIKEYEKENIIIYTPSRFLNGKLIKPYDDRFIVQYASEREGVIISNDNYSDLINEESSWRTTIEQRIINFTFARGLFMLPKDPLGPDGPTLDEMLKFPLT